MKINKLNEDKGVTLIVVVITVVVLIILSSVAIRTVTTDRALERATNTREEIEKFDNTSQKDQNRIYDLIKSEEED